MEVIATDEFAEWYVGLPEKEHDGIYEVVSLLERRGIALPFPYSSEIKGSRYSLRELRKKCGRHQLRVIYAFDPRRNAVLLLGGDKTGDDRFYETHVPRAEKVWLEYLSEQRSRPEKERDK
jgi:hypothetical protein